MQNPAAGYTKDIEVVVQSMYFISFWSILEMPLINCEIDLILTWSANCIIMNISRNFQIKLRKQNCNCYILSDYHRT